MNGTEAEPDNDLLAHNGRALVICSRVDGSGKDQSGGIQSKGSGVTRGRYE